MTKMKAVSVLCMAFFIFHLTDGRSPPLPVQKCTKITHTQCQTSSGYLKTAPFPDVQGKPYQEVKGKELTKYLNALSSCAKTSSAAVLCSLYFPKCEEHLTRPILPCRSVCNDFTHKCRSELHLAAMQGMFSSMCDLLPVYDGNPDTCFVPKGFNVSFAHKGLNKTQCHKVGISKCQDDLHYNTTFVSPESQNKSEVHLLQSVIATKCSPNIEKFTCFTRFPPCSKGTVQIPCKSTCVDINKSCKTQFDKYNIPMNDCDFLYPDKKGTSGICSLSKWPAPWSAGVQPPTTMQPTRKPPVCSKCNKITIRECSNIGYSHTFHFKDINKVPYQNHTASALGKFIKLLTCSKYARTILCSLYLPKCDPYTCSLKPVLPCRRVCYEFVRKCDSYLGLAAIHGLMIGLCDLLPWNNTDATPCFLPEDFKPTAEVYNRQVCYAVKSNDEKCHKDFSYNATFINPKEQSSKAHLLQPIISSKCSAKAEKFFCYTRFPPCSRKGQLTVPLPCRSMCNEVLGKCKDVFTKYGIPMPDCNFLLPDEGEDGICQADAFPVPFRHFKQIHHPHMYIKTPGRKKVNGGLIAGIVILIIVVIAVVVLGVLYYRKRQFLKPFQPQELHNVEGKNEENTSSA